MRCAWQSYLLVTLRPVTVASVFWAKRMPHTPSVDLSRPAVTGAPTPAALFTAVFVSPRGKGRKPITIPRTGGTGHPPRVNARFARADDSSLPRSRSADAYTLPPSPRRGGRGFRERDPRRRLLGAARGPCSARRPRHRHAGPRSLRALGARARFDGRARHRNPWLAARGPVHRRAVPPGRPDARGRQRILPARPVVRANARPELDDRRGGHDAPGAHGFRARANPANRSTIAGWRGSDLRRRAG